MNSTIRRCFCSTKSLTSRSDNIKRIVLNAGDSLRLTDTKGKVKDNQNRSEYIRTKKPSHVLRDWKALNQKYSDPFIQPNALEINSANHFFNYSTVKYEWSASHFMKVPGETTGKFEFANVLPEVAFLGKSNVGKSTLLNSLTTNSKQSSPNNYARTSKKAGFTQTLNSFNIGNKFRIIDTPGYGYNSTVEQGNLTVEYISRRKQLLGCFLLISGEQEGLGEMDLQIIEFLSMIGKPFEIVFTKMDKVKDINRLQEMNLQDLPGLPNIIFTNSLISRNCPKRYGVDLLRHWIFQRCVVTSGAKWK